MKVNYLEHGYLISTSQLDSWCHVLKQDSILYFFGVPGLGKTTKALALAQHCEELTLRYFSALDGSLIERAERFLQEANQSKESYLLILDDLAFYQEDLLEVWIEDRLLRHVERPPNVKIILISLMKLPKNLTKYALLKRLTLIDANAFFLNENDIRDMLLHEAWSKSADKKTLDARARECLKLTSGYPIAVRSYIKHMIQDDPPLKQLSKRITHDVLDVLLSADYSWFDQRLRKTMTTLSVFLWYSEALAQELLGTSWKQKVELIHERIAAVKEVGDGYQFMPYVQPALQQRMKVYYSAREERNLFRLAGTINEKYGRRGEALKCYLRAGDQEKILENSLILLARLHYPTVRLFVEEHLLDQFSLESTNDDPAMLGAKATLAFIQMNSVKAERYLECLREKAATEQKTVDEDAGRQYTSHYLRTLITMSEIRIDCLSSVLDILWRFRARELDVLTTPARDKCVPFDRLDSILFKHCAADDSADSELADLLGYEAHNRLRLMLAKYCFEVGETSKAMSLITNVLNDGSGKTPFRFRVFGERKLAYIHMTLGEPDKARHILESLLVEADRFINVDLRGTIVASIALLDLKENRLDRVQAWLEMEQRDPLEPALTIDYYRICIEALAHLALGDSMSALRRLLLFEPFAKTYPHSYLNVSLQIHKAIALYRMNEDWQPSLKEAFSLAAPQGLCQMFANHGAVLLPLWQKITPSGEIEMKFHEAVRRRMMKMAGYYPEYLISEELSLQSISLSKREYDVLKLVKAGKTNKEISDALFIGVSTVKYHLANIMKKLGAINRTDAVRRAQEIGIH